MIQLFSFDAVDQSGKQIPRAFHHTPESLKARSHVAKKHINVLIARTNDLTMTGSTISIYRSSSTAYREFCSNCGSHLTFRHSDSPDVVDPAIGTLDNPELFAPNNQIWGDDNLNFLEVLI